MKKTLLVTAISAASAALSLAAPAPEAAQTQSYPKNLARQHLGANLFQYMPESQAYQPTQASAAWLDDDITTGWSAMAGKQYYLLALPQAELLTNFCLSARPASGTISLYVGDELAPPTGASWNAVAKDVPLESVNEKKLAQPFSRVAKYLLIETNIADPGPIYSLYVYGDKSAASYTVHQRTQPIDVHAVFGAYVNDATSINVAGLYSQSTVKTAEGVVDTAAQRAIDDNPESSVTLGGSGAAAELPITLGSSQSVSRIAMQVDPGAKGRFDFFLTDGAAEGTETPAASIILDGSSARAAVDFSPARATMIKARWTPANGTDTIAVHELDAFAGQSLAANSVIAEGTYADASESTKSGRSTRDGKDMQDPKAIAEGKDAKDAAAPIGALDSGPYLPGALGFPPTPGFGITRIGGPQTPKSP